MGVGGALAAGAGADAMSEAAKREMRNNARTEDATRGMNKYDRKSYLGAEEKRRHNMDKVDRYGKMADSAKDGSLKQKYANFMKNGNQSLAKMRSKYEHDLSKGKGVLSARAAQAGRGFKKVGSGASKMLNKTRAAAKSGGSKVSKSAQSRLAIMGNKAKVAGSKVSNGASKLRSDYRTGNLGRNRARIEHRILTGATDTINSAKKGAKGVSQSLRKGAKGIPGAVVSGAKAAGGMAVNSARTAGSAAFDTGVRSVQYASDGMRRVASGAGNVAHTASRKSKSVYVNHQRNKRNYNIEKNKFRRK
jgi:hypothetical protein